MSIALLKEKVINGIRNLENENLVAEIYALLQLEKGEPILYELNEEQIKIVEEGQEQYRNGKYLTDEEAQKHFEEWQKR